MEKVRIESIKVKAIFDEMADVSCIGEYTDEIEQGVIVRDTGEWITKHILFWGSDNEMEIIPIPSKGNEYRFFKPYAGGEKIGTRNYRKYGMQDFKRMEGLSSGDWCFYGIQAQAEVSYSISNNGDRRLEYFTSGGLWGIESDSGDYLGEVAQEQFKDLKEYLEQFGVDTSNFDELTEDIELEY